MKTKTQKSKSPAADPNTPPALVRFMMQDWRPTAKKLPPRIGNAAVFAKRRAVLSTHFPGDTLVIPTGSEKVRANDTHFRFRAGSDFYYLTGNLEPDCVLVLTPELKGPHRSHLFVEPNPGKTSSTFFTDRHKGELWVGQRLGVTQSCARYGVDEAHPLDELNVFLKQHRRMRVLRGFESKLDANRSTAAHDKADQLLATTLSEMRLLKDKLEIAELELAIASTKRGFEDVIRTIPSASSEREIEGVFAMRARNEGNDVGYGIIAAAGANACILHWTHNNAALKAGDLLLLDAGVEGHCLYTADITRTLPLSGKFSPAQREIYDLVHQAHQAAMAAVKPSSDFLDPNRSAMRVLAHGLERLGILPMPADEALKDENLFYKRYSLHNVSHMLGLDVHDCAKARQENYRYGKLKAGMVLTIEPGLYFQNDDLTVPAKYRGIGIRIEDDVVVTPRGCRNLSEDIPTQVDEIEAWMRQVQNR